MRSMKDWSWDIVKEFLKKTPPTTKILKVVVLNLVYSIYIYIYISSSLVALNFDIYIYIFIKV